MNIRPEIVAQHLHDMVISQLSFDYAKKGYKIQKEEKMGDYTMDLVARKGDECIVFDIKSLNKKMTLKEKAKFKKIHTYIKSHGYELHVVFARPPQKKEIEIWDIKNVLLAYLTHTSFPSELDSLSSNTSIEEITDIEIEKLQVAKNGHIQVQGSGSIGVELQYGPESDGYTTHDSFPFNFDIIIKSTENGFEVEKKRNLKIDTSSFSN